MEQGREHAAYLLQQLSRLENTGIFFAGENEGENTVVSYEKNSDGNPLYQSAGLRAKIMEQAAQQEEPFIWSDEFGVYFAGIRAEGGCYLVGPMSAEIFHRVKRHHFYRAYGIDEVQEKNLRQFTLIEILQTVGLVAGIVTGREYEDQELLDANHLLNVPLEKEHEEQIRFTIQSDEEDFYRHSYQEEVELLRMVEEGNVSEAVRLSKEMDAEIGRLGNDELTHWRNMLIVSATLCARAAIRGGVKPYIAYRISGFYINKGSECKNAVQLFGYRNHAVEEFARRVQEFRLKRHTSSYTEQCKDYIRKNFRRKIYLDDIAEMLGISSSYLSRLFKKETGKCIQDYVNEIRVERAANLLIYSNESLPNIAEYVNFPSQSYFGKIFKQHTNMTPRQYREAYKPMEFLETKQQTK